MSTVFRNSAGLVSLPNLWHSEENSLKLREFLFSMHRFAFKVLISIEIYCLYYVIGQMGGN